MVELLPTALGSQSDFQPQPQWSQRPSTPAAGPIRLRRFREQRITVYELAA